MRPQRTHALGAFAVGATVTAVALEYAHVWRRGRAPLPSETEDVLDASRQAARDTMEIAIVGFKTASRRENALLNLLLSFSLAFGFVRMSTWMIRNHGEFGPVRNVRLGDRHIHHFVPGIVLSLLAGGGAIVTREKRADRWLAIPFGIGAALTLDEAALLLQLEDVYWTEEGVLSVQVTLSAMAVLAALALGLRVLRRGERAVLPHWEGPPIQSPA